MRKILLIFTVFGFSLFQSILAQQKTVTGVVTDASTNEPIPGVNVVVKNTTLEIIKDSNSRNLISVFQGESFIFISIGYNETKLANDALNQVNVKLAQVLYI